jgi:hypothetical protein
VQPGLKLLWRVLLSAVVSATFVRGATPPSEFDLKAVFLFHFTQFVDWPEDAYPAANAPFTIGILGPDPFEASLTSIVRGESVGLHPIVVRDVRSEAVELRCQILYVSREGEPLLEFRKIRSAPILTVGESEAFYQEGGVIQFYIDRRRVRLRVNLEEARARSLGISAKLLRVSEVTGGRPTLMDFAGIMGDANSRWGRGPAQPPVLNALPCLPGGAEFGMAGAR